LLDAVWVSSEIMDTSRSVSLLWRNSISISFSPEEEGGGGEEEEEEAEEEAAFWLPSINTFSSSNSSSDSSSIKISTISGNSNDMEYLARF